MFRKDIQALRAFAVAAVILFHAGVPFIHSGFVGVDVFFVISGYLIIGMLVSEFQEHGQIRLLAFFGRRARRLLPASAAVLLFVVGMSWWSLGAQEGQRALKDVIAASFYSANLRFAANAMDYWAPASVSPIVHYWSLGVEEQFYIVFPLLLAALVLAIRGLKVRLFELILCLIVLTSFWLMWNQTSTGNPWAFYGPQCRAWEFAIGGIAATVGHRHQLRNRELARKLWWLCATGLLASAFMFNEGTLWPSQLTALPVLCCALLLWAGDTSVTQVELSPRITQFRWVQNLGSWSYSIYLWHWPLLFFAARIFTPTQANPSKMPLVIAIPVIAVSLLLAKLTYSYVENPIRNSDKFRRSPKRSLSAGLAISLAVSLTATAAIAFPAGRLSTTPYANITDAKAVGIVNPSWVQQIIDANTPPVLASDVQKLNQKQVASARFDMPRTYSDGCHAGVDQSSLPAHCTYGNPQAKFLIASFGNSHANQYFDAILQAATANNSRFLSMTHSGCSVADVTFLKGSRPWAACNQWRKNAVKELLKQKPDILFVVSTLKTLDVVDPLTNHASTQARGALLYKQGFRRLIHTFTSAGIKVIVIRDTPFFPQDPIDCLSARVVSACTQLLKPYLPVTKFSTAAVAGLANAVGIDLTQTFCSPSLCPAVRDGVIVWRDGNHLTDTYVNKLGSIFTGIVRHELQ
jgi:peptidoglycan/LPS O-acetylase OafA/YrhL